MTAGEWAAVALMTPFGVYIVARVIFAAYFFTARQFKERERG